MLVEIRACVLIFVFTYKKEFVYDILKMYMEECQKALLRGERVQISGVGTIISEVKTCESFNVPQCNKEEGKNNSS